jgi:hypothetical protein
MVETSGRDFCWVLVLPSERILLFSSFSVCPVAGFASIFALFTTGPFRENPRQIPPSHPDRSPRVFPAISLRVGGRFRGGISVICRPRWRSPSFLRELSRLEAGAAWDGKDQPFLSRGALASNIAGMLGVAQQGRRPALLSGAVAGLAAAFNTPLSAFSR